MNPSIDLKAAVDRLMRFLSVEGVTGQEKKIGREVHNALREVGVSQKHIRFDTANERIPLPTQTGNLIVDFPGTQPGPRLLFMTHLDTVPLCAGAVPVRKGNKIVPQGRTALGGDNRTGCAVLVTLAATLIEHQLPHPPITLLFTVREESGLFGARYLDPADLHGPVMGFNVDGRSAADITIGAVGAERWEVDIHGKASHAGVYPERGISASMIASLALANAFDGGWFGKVVKQNKRGTSNIGSIGDANGKSAGEATNVVTDFVHLRGESRSHDAKFVREITQRLQRCLQIRCRTGSGPRRKNRQAEVYIASRLSSVPSQRKRPGRAVCGRSGEIDRPRTKLQVVKRRPRRQLDRQARHPHDHIRRGAERNPHGQGMGRSR